MSTRVILLFAAFGLIGCRTGSERPELQHHADGPSYSLRMAVNDATDIVILRVKDVTETSQTIVEGDTENFTSQENLVFEVLIPLKGNLKRGAREVAVSRRRNGWGWLKKGSLAVVFFERVHSSLVPPKRYSNVPLHFSSEVAKYQIGSAILRWNHEQHDLCCRPGNIPEEETWQSNQIDSRRILESSKNGDRVPCRQAQQEADPGKLGS